MLHHVSIEVPPDEAERMVEFWDVLGFEELEAPERIREYVRWVERDGTQIHLILTEAAAIPTLGHPAVVAPDWDSTIEALGAAGFEFEEHDQLWGERRGFAIAPGGHRVEVMAAPPPPGTGAG
jgi:catechol 2,3-dioxygenase-like lactoylglutathione lyase family enzyme